MNQTTGTGAGEREVMMELVRCGSLAEANQKKLTLMLHGSRCCSDLVSVSCNYNDNDAIVESIDLLPTLPESIDIGNGRIRYNIVGSCDDLLLLVVSTSDNGCDGGYVIYIWNPLTGDYKTLPQLKSSMFENNVFGFGRDFTTTTTESDHINYKVLFLETTYKRGEPAVFKVNVYTTHNNSWNTQLPDIPYIRSFCSLKGMILAYDSLHHLAEIDDTAEDEDNETIISFDLKDDKFRELPMVPETVISICALKGDLCALSNGEDMDLYNLWKMENFGFKEKECWTITFSIDSRALLDQPISFRSPLHLYEEGELLLTANYKAQAGNPFIVCYHTENKKARFLIQGSELSFPTWSVPVIYDEKNPISLLADEEQLSGQSKRRRT